MCRSSERRGSSLYRGAFILATRRGRNSMPETAAATAMRLFLAHEETLEHAAETVYQILIEDTKLTPDECFVVCLRAAAKFLIRYDKNEWRDMIKHASELLLEHAALYKKNMRQYRLGR